MDMITAGDTVKASWILASAFSEYSLLPVYCQTRKINQVAIAIGLPSYTEGTRFSPGMKSATLLHASLTRGPSDD